MSLKAEFQDLAFSGLTGADRETWNPILPRDPRLLVPIDVRALVVTAEDQVERADVRMHAFEKLYPGEPPSPQVEDPSPFTDLGFREAGVYLHWALPDGLTAGVARGTREAPTLEGAPEGTAEADLAFRPLPSRWLVIRIEQGRVPRTTRAWVLESERGRSFPLEEWPSAEGLSEGEKPIEPEALNVFACGDPAWAATYDNVENRFAFRDDLVGLNGTSDSLAYLVVGWYSVPELDPLHAATGKASFEKIISQLGWNLPEDPVESVWKAAETSANRARELGLRARPPTPAGVAARTQVAEREVSVPATTVNSSLMSGIEAPVVKLTPWAITQTLFHGVIYGVQLNKQDREDARDGVKDVAAAVGQTAAEALAVLVSSVTHPSSIARAERLQTALLCGLLHAIDEPDGLGQIELALHARGFVAEPSGSETAWIHTGDPFADLRNRAGSVTQPTSDLTSRAPTRTSPLSPVSFGLISGDRFSASRYLNEAIESVGISRGLGARLVDPLRDERVEIGLPRWFTPRNPVLLLRGLKRSLRHGYDGRFDTNDVLECRLSGTTVSRFGSLVDGPDVVGRLNHGGIPPEAQDLLYEAVLEDPLKANVQAMVQIAVQRTGLPRENVEIRLQAESQLFLELRKPCSDAVHLLPASIKDGIGASPAASQLYTQPWVPLFLEWELELGLETDLRGWRLGELDFERAPEMQPKSRIVSGRSLLAPTASEILVEAIHAFLADEERFDSQGLSRIPEEDEDQLRRLVEGLEFVDIVTAPLPDLSRQLLGFGGGRAAFREHVANNEEVTPPEDLPTDVPELLRSGIARLRRLRVVDAFSRTLEIPLEVISSLPVGEALRPEDAVPPGTGDIEFPPRILRPSRLWFRFISAETQTPRDGASAEASGVRDKARRESPIIGWLLPDQIDRALEVFDSDGRPLGQLRELRPSWRPDAPEHGTANGAPPYGGLVWETAPGSAIGSNPGDAIDQAHIAAFVTELLRRDAAERAETPRTDGPLSALLDVIDTTLWTIDPLGDTGTEHVALLTGRPMAMVRAELRVEVQQDPQFNGLDEELRKRREAEFERLSQIPFEVRLGAMNRFDDGLLGYFVDDDYRHFYPVQAQVLDRIASGRVGSTYIVRDPTISLRPTLVPSPREEAAGRGESPVGEGNQANQSIDTSRTINVTLLMDPGGKVHATSGILPRKGLTLPREFISNALARLAPAFRVGPVLVDPNLIRMPRAAALGKDQVWTRRDTPRTWQDNSIIATTQDALLSDQPAVAQEGFMRVKPAPKETPEP